MKALGRSLLLLALALAGLAPAAVPDVLFVAGSTAPPAPDPFIVARISAMGFNPVIVDDNAVTLADAAGKAFIFISESCVSATLTTLFRDVTIPVICSEANLYDDMQMTGPTAGTYYGNTPLQTSLYIRDPSHYLADGYSNTVIVFSPSRDLYWGVPAPSASVIAVMPATPSQACIFAYEPGQPMNGGFPAPARRLGFYLGPLAADAMTATGRNLLDRALLWAAGAAPATPTWTPTSTPTGTPTWSPTPTPTHSPTHSPTSTDSPTPTWTVSPTATPTVTLTASPTPLPPIVMQLLVFDSEQRLVKDLGSTYSYLPAPSLSAAPDPYAPEDGSLTATAGAFLWNWAGDRADGKGVPNGQYQFVLKQTGAGDVKAHVWLEHKAASLGAAVFYPNPAQKGTVSLSLQAKAGVSTELLLYSIAGELVLQKRFGPLLTLALIELRSPSGQALAPGIYLARIRLSAQGGVEQVLERKLAVTR